jgi:hypothetical protein
LKAGHLHTIDPASGGQGQWEHCSNCGELFYAGSATIVPCPHGGKHVAQGSECYLGANYPNSFLVGGSGGGPEWLPGSTFSDMVRGLNVAVDSFGGSANAPTVTITISWDRVQSDMTGMLWMD